MTNERAILELEQIYGILSPEKQMAIDKAIEAIRAFEIACELLNDHWLFGWDRERIFKKMMEKDGVVSSRSYEIFILENLDYLTNGGEAENG